MARRVIDYESYFGTGAVEVDGGDADCADFLICGGVAVLLDHTHFRVRGRDGCVFVCFSTDFDFGLLVLIYAYHHLDDYYVANHSPDRRDLCAAVGQTNFADLHYQSVIS